jgi:hypothetical protein
MIFCMNRRWKASIFHSWLFLAGCLGLASGGNQARAASGPVSEAEAENFGRQLEVHIGRKEMMFYINAFDFTRMLDKVVPVATRQAGDSDFLGGFENGMRYGLEVQTKGIKSLKFLRTTHVKDGTGALMRMITTNNLVNYQNLSLQHDATGRIRIDDAYVYLSGEWLSETTRRTALPILEERDKSVMARLFGDTSDLVKYEPQWAQMPTLNQHGKYQEALDVYAGLPPKLQREKFLLVQRLRAAEAVNQKDYLATLKLWRQCYPDDPSIDIISIDYFTLTKDYGQAMACIDRLDQVLGGDPYLDFERAALYSLKNDKANAEKFARQAWQREPDLLLAGFFAVRLMGMRQDYVACVDLLKQMNSRGGFPKTALDRGLRSSAAYAALLQSEPYQKWFFSPDDMPALTPMTVPSKPDGGRQY